MYQYGIPQLDLFYGLILEANPDIDITLSENTLLGVPQTQSVPEGGIADTRIRINGINLLYRSEVIQYRRIDLSKYFNGVTVVFDKYIESGVMSKAIFVAELLRVYGLNLTVADITTTSLTSGVLTNIVVDAKSLCFKGTFPVTWTSGPRDVSEEIVSPTSLAGRLFPGGNTFGGGRKQQGEYFCYSQSFELLSAVLLTLTTGTLDYTVASHKMVIDYLKANVSQTFSGSTHTVTGGLNGLTFARYTLPNVNVPNANALREGITSVFAITAKSDSWFQGTILMHF